MSAALVRPAGPADADAAAAAIEQLLIELDGERPPLERMAQTARELLADPAAGALLLAEDGGETVGLLAASWQLAIHVPGRYATVQDLWVRPEWRGGGVGAQLVAALAALARERGVRRLEVGLPSAGFEGLERTEGFYAGCGFERLGPRMRLLLDGEAEGERR